MFFGWWAIRKTWLGDHDLWALQLSAWRATSVPLLGHANFFWLKVVPGGGFPSHWNAKVIINAQYLTQIVLVHVVLMVWNLLVVWLRDLFCSDSSCIQAVFWPEQCKFSVSHCNQGNGNHSSRKMSWSLDIADITDIWIDSVNDPPIAWVMSQWCFMHCAAAPATWQPDNLTAIRHGGQRRHGRAREDGTAVWATLFCWFAAWCEIGFCPFRSMVKIFEHVIR